MMFSSKMFSNDTVGSPLLVPVIVMEVMVVVFVVLGMASKQVEVVASHYCDRYIQKKHLLDHQNHPQDHYNHLQDIRNQDN